MALARSPRRWTTMVVVALGLILGALSGATVAWAFFSGGSATEANAVTADTLPQGATPSTPVTTPRFNSNTVQVTFSQVSTTTGNVALTSYTLRRYPTAGGSAVTVSASCSISSDTVTCNESLVPDGNWQYTDTPTYSTNWVGIESSKSGTVTVDTTGPSVAAPTVTAGVTYSSNPVFVNNETVTLTDTSVTDTGSGVQSVTYYYCPTSAGSCTSGNGTQIGSPATSTPYMVTWNTPLPTDGPYQIVAVAADNAGNTTTSAATLVTVDTTPPTVPPPSVNG